MNIPEKGTGCFPSQNVGITSKLRKLNVGDSMVLPKTARHVVHTCASQIGMKVVTRSLGSKDSFTVWRVE